MEQFSFGKKTHVCQTRKNHEKELKKKGRSLCWWWIPGICCFWFKCGCGVLWGVCLPRPAQSGRLTPHDVQIALHIGHMGADTGRYRIHRAGTAETSQHGAASHWSEIVELIPAMGPKKGDCRYIFFLNACGFCCKSWPCGWFLQKVMFLWTSNRTNLYLHTSQSLLWYSVIRNSPHSKDFYSVLLVRNKRDPPVLAGINAESMRNQCLDWTGVDVNAHLTEILRKPDQ